MNQDLFNIHSVGLRAHELKDKVHVAVSIEMDLNRRLIY